MNSIDPNTIHERTIYENNNLHIELNKKYILPVYESVRPQNKKIKILSVKQM